MTDGFDDWPTPVGEVPLNGDSLHVWRAWIDTLPRSFRPESLLPESELEEAGRFRFARDSQRFLGRRAALRSVLSRYTGTEPEKLQFTRNQYGKPHLVDSGGFGRLNFSTSHSAAMAVICIARSVQVGIDIQYRPDWPITDHEARSVLTPTELCELSEDGRHDETFLRYWTCKEALVKAIGMGLSIPLDDIEIADIKNDCPKVRRIAKGHGSPTQWHLRQFVPAPGYAGAMAFRGKSMKIQTWTWDADDPIASSQ